MAYMTKEDSDVTKVIVKLLDCYSPVSDTFDIHCGYEYFNNHSQEVSSLSQRFRQYEFVVLTLRAVVKENLHTMISPIYLQELIQYIEICEIEKNWYYIFQGLQYFHIIDLYLRTIKYELVQYNVSDCFYLLKVKCMNFREMDVRSCSNVVHCFFSGCFDRVISVCPQIQWRFCGNPYMNVTWIIAVPKRLKDNFTGYRRKLLNESWNDFYGGSEWRPPLAKKNGLMDYMKKLTGYHTTTIANKGSNPFSKFVSKNGSLFEVDDTIFAKFSDEKEVIIRRSIFSCSTLILALALIVLVRWYCNRFH